MKTYYIAGFVPEEDGKFSVYFPDIEGCVTWGENLAHATDAAADALRGMLEYMARTHEALPVPSPLESIREKVKNIRKTDELAYPEDTVYQLVPAPNLDNVQVRINVSLPKSTLAAIDEKAQLLGFTRSGFLVHAAQAYRQEQG